MEREERRYRYVKYSCAPLHGEWGSMGGCQVEEGVSEWRRGGCRGRGGEAERRRRWLNDTTKMSSWQFSADPSGALFTSRQPLQAAPSSPSLHRPVSRSVFPSLLRFVSLSHGWGWHAEQRSVWCAWGGSSRNKTHSCKIALVLREPHRCSRRFEPVIRQIFTVLQF